MRTRRTVASGDRAGARPRSAPCSSARLDRRVDQPCGRAGLVDEVRGPSCPGAGSSEGSRRRRAIGYAQALAQLRGELNGEADAIARDAAPHPPLRPPPGELVPPLPRCVQWITDDRRHGGLRSQTTAWQAVAGRVAAEIPGAADTTADRDAAHRDSSPRVTARATTSSCSPIPTATDLSLRRSGRPRLRPPLRRRCRRRDPGRPLGEPAGGRCGSARDRAAASTPSLVHGLPQRRRLPGRDVRQRHRASSRAT